MAAVASYPLVDDMRSVLSDKVIIHNNNDQSFNNNNAVSGKVKAKYEELTAGRGTTLQQFYDGTNIFITGGTGFLGKILLDKLMRSCPGIENIYLLVRQKKGKDVHSRIEEIFDDAVFETLKKEVPKFRHKIVVIPGDVSMAGLGLSLSDRQLLIDKVDIVFHAAATVKFDEKISLALSINVDGVKSILELGKSMTKLKSFVHVSTAYSNCSRKDIGERFYHCQLKCEEVEKLVAKLDDQAMEEITPKILGPWPNTYTFTKALAEDYIRQNSKGIPMGMFRPAIVTSTFKEPVVGWIDNLYGPTGVIAGAASGILRTLHCDSKMYANIVPVDFCVNALIVAAWDISNNAKERKEENMLIYNYVSTVENPLTWRDLLLFNTEYGFTYPLSSAVWYYSFTLNKSAIWHKIYSTILHTIPAIFVDGIAVCIGQKPRLLKMYKKVHKFSEVISYFCTHDWDYTNDNVQNLWQKIDQTDKKLFPFSIKDVDWVFYFTYYIKGIRTYLFKEECTQEEAKKRWKRFYYLHLTLKAVLTCSFSYATISILYKLFTRALRS